MRPSFEEADQFFCLGHTNSFPTCGEELTSNPRCYPDLIDWDGDRSGRMAMNLFATRGAAGDRSRPWHRYL